MNLSKINKTILVCDMDGTLLNSQCLVSEENRRSIERFVNNGGLFTLATGRMEFSIKQYLKQLPVNIPAILYNGAAIYDLNLDKVLWTKCLDEDTGCILTELMGRFPGLGIEIFHNGDIYFVQENEETEKHQIKEGFKRQVLPVEEIPKPWYKVILAWDNSKLKDVDLFLKSKYGSFRTVFSETYFLEILHSDVSKGYALNELVKMLGLSEFRVVAVGDNLNDREMLEAAHVGIAVDNAHPELKNSANACCCCNDEHAIAQVIEWIESGI